MRFVMDGEEFDLTPEKVRSRLEPHAPESIQEHWVDVDGQRWPVKQALAIATGARNNRFVSRTARRHFRNLGFETSETGGLLLAHPAAPRATRRAIDPVTLPVLDPVSVLVAFNWRDAGQATLDSNGLPTFPALPRTPGLYRFDFHPLGAEDVRRVYIGESINLSRRGSNYRNAKTDRTSQRTSRRIHRELVAHLSSGGTVDFAITVEVSLGRDGGPIDLRWKSARRLAENAAILMAQMDSTLTVLNLDADLGTAEMER